MIGIIGTKLGMTQIFNEQGQQIPVTVIEAQPNPVLGVTDKAKVGHASVQLGYGASRLRRDSQRGEKKIVKGHRATLASVGHAKKAGLETVPRVLRSVRLDYLNAQFDRQAALIELEQLRAIDPKDVKQ